MVDLRFLLSPRAIQQATLRVGMAILPHAKVLAVAREMGEDVMLVFAIDGKGFHALIPADDLKLSLEAVENRYIVPAMRREAMWSDCG